MKHSNNIIELDNVTIQDCIELYNMKNVKTIINDGHIVTFLEENEKMFV